MGRLVRRTSHLLRWAALLSFATSVALASGMQSLESIQRAAEDHVRAHLPQGEARKHARYYITAARLDPRLRLAACPRALETFFPNGGTPGARATIGVRCAGDVQWTIYVQVAVEVEAPVLVLRRALPRHAPISPGDVELQRRRMPGIDVDFIADPANLAGYRLKRAAAAGTPLSLDVLAPDLLVKRGQQVTLIAGSGPVEIRAQGKALNDGALAERVRVQNASSLKVVEGIVESPGVVRTGL